MKPRVNVAAGSRERSLSSSAWRRRIEIFVAEEISSRLISRMTRSLRSSSPKLIAGGSVMPFEPMDVGSKSC